jgi:hypothetical protein
VPTEALEPRCCRASLGIRTARLRSEPARPPACPPAQGKVALEPRCQELLLQLREHYDPLLRRGQQGMPLAEVARGVALGPNPLQLPEAPQEDPLLRVLEEAEEAAAAAAAAQAAAAEAAEAEAQAARRRAAGGAARRPKSCACCGGQPPKFKMCGGCRRVRYCSPACQKQHWPEHMRDCPAGLAKAPAGGEAGAGGGV